MKFAHKILWDIISHDEISQKICYIYEDISRCLQKFSFHKISDTFIKLSSTPIISLCRIHIYYVILSIKKTSPLLNGFGIFFFANSIDGLKVRSVTNRQIFHSKIEGIQKTKKEKKMPNRKRENQPGPPRPDIIIIVSCHASCNFFLLICFTCELSLITRVTELVKIQGEDEYLNF